MLSFPLHITLEMRLAGMMAFCMLMSTLTPAHPLASPRGEGFAPAAINSPLFCLFSLQSSILRFKALKIIHNFSFLTRPCRMFV